MPAARETRLPSGVRDATPLDAWEIAAVHVEAWQVGYRGLVPDAVLDGLSVAVRERWWHEMLSTPGTRSTLVVTDEQALLGFAAVGPQRDGHPEVGELYAIYLRPRAWGRGFGRAVHTAAMDRLWASGHESASLWMLAGNERARRFYLRQGWREDGRAKQATGPGGVALQHRGLTRPLPP